MVFGTLEHDLLLTKLRRYGIRLLQMIGLKAVPTKPVAICYI